MAEISLCNNNNSFFLLFLSDCKDFFPCVVYFDFVDIFFIARIRIMQQQQQKNISHLIWIWILIVDEIKMSLI